MNDRNFSGKLRKSIITYAVLGIFTISVVIAMVCIVPLYDYLQKEVERNLAAGLKVRAMAVEEHLAKARSIAMLIAARTGLREKMVAYNKGEIPLSELTKFVSEGFVENLRQWEEVAGIGCLDQNNHLTVELGLPVPEQYRPVPAVGSREVLIGDPIQLAGGLYIVIGAPLLDAGFNRVGTYIVLFKLSYLQKIVRDYTGLGKTGETILARGQGNRVQLLFPLRGDEEKGEESLARDSPLGSLLNEALHGHSGIAVLDEDPAISSDGRSSAHGVPVVVAYRPVQDTAWGIAIKIDKREAYAGVTHQIAVVAGVILVLVVLGASGMLLLLWPVTGKIIVHSDELEKEIEERTTASQNELHERRQVEEALRRAEHEKELILGSVSDMVTYLDEDLTVIWANRAACEALALPSDQVVGKRCYRLFHQKELICRDCPTPRVHETGLMQEREAVTPDGRIVLERNYPVRAPDGAIIGVVRSARDITERKYKEEQLVRLSTAIEHAAETVTIVDTAGIIQYVNPAFEFITGFSRQESLGHHFKMLRSNEGDDEASFRHIAQSLSHGDTWKGLAAIRKKNGSRFRVDLAISPVRSPAGAITHYVAVGRDVSREAKLEQQLVQAQKMEAIGTLAAGIAHDFNNILMPIMVNAGMVARSLSEDDPNRVRLDRVIRASWRAKGLIRQILDFSRKSSGERKPLQVTPIVKETLKLLRASLPGNIEIRQELSLTSDIILSDPSQFQQVLMNLFTNAAHAMEANGGVLDVKLKNVTIDASVVDEHPGLSPGEYLSLVVSDSGCGIDPDIIDRIFEPYFTTKKPGEGTGLGLAVTHGIVQRLDGALTVRSDPGKGSRFEVLIPRAEMSAQMEDDIVDPLAKGKASILIVDDEEDILTTLSDLLGSLGYQVATRKSSIEALKTFRSQPDAFDLVVTDQIMPNMSGSELIEELLCIRSTLPIILCSGYGEVPMVAGGKQPGVFRHVTKPIDAREITEVIGEVLEECRPVSVKESREAIDAQGADH